MHPQLKKWVGGRVDRDMTGVRNNALLQHQNLRLAAEKRTTVGWQRSIRIGITMQSPISFYAIADSVKQKDRGFGHAGRGTATSLQALPTKQQACRS